MGNEVDLLALDRAPQVRRVAIDEAGFETRISVERIMRLSALAVSNRKMKMLAMIAPSGRSMILAMVV